MGRTGIECIAGAWDFLFLADFLIFDKFLVPKFQLFLLFSAYFWHLYPISRCFSFFFCLWPLTALASDEHGNIHVGIRSLQSFAICRESLDLEPKYACTVEHKQPHLCTHKSQRITCEWNRHVKAVNSISTWRLYLQKADRAKNEYRW